MSARADLGPKPHLGYTDNKLDRAAEMRREPATIVALAADARARTFVIGGEVVLVHQDAPLHDPLFTFAQATALAPTPQDLGEQVFLGLRDGTPMFAIALSRDAAAALKENPPAGVLATDLRSIAMGAMVAADYLPMLAEAKAVLGWHGRHRFCANCGALTDVIQAGWRRDCPVCGTEHFPRTDPVVIMLVVHGERCLLGRQSRFAKGQWSCLAGFVEPGETVEEAVRRETLEESGIVCGRVAYFASQPWPFPMSLMIGCHAEALTTDITIDHTELEDVRWFDRDEVPAMLLRRHPDGLLFPNPVAIAHHIIRAWLEAERSLV